MKTIIIILLFLQLTLISAQEEGYASWYGGLFHGRLTANGEIFDMNTLTAAHKTLPFNTIVKVINLENEMNVIVRINDRGPFVEGRIIDLAKGAAEEIDLIGKGVAKVKLEILEIDETLLENKVSSIPVIQIGSFSKLENAEYLKKILESKDFSVLFEDSLTGYIRVLVKVAENQSTDLTLEALKQIGFVDVLVRNKID